MFNLWFSHLWVPWSYTQDSSESYLGKRVFGKFGLNEWLPLVGDVVGCSSCCWNLESMNSSSQCYLWFRALVLIQMFFFFVAFLELLWENQGSPDPVQGLMLKESKGCNQVVVGKCPCINLFPNFQSSTQCHQFGLLYLGPFIVDLTTCIQKMQSQPGISALGGVKVDFGKYLVRQSIASLFFVCRNL